MEFQPGLILAGCCVDIDGIFVQGDDGTIGNENVSKAFETAVQISSSGIEILSWLEDYRVDENGDGRSDEEYYDVLKTLISIINPDSKSQSTKLKKPVRPDGSSRH